mgnify:CR=1 FL=1
MTQKSNFLEILNYQLKSQSLSHAYLVLGLVGVEEVQSLLKVKNPDLLMIQENPIKISHIRELIHWANIKPHSSERKLAFILNVNNLTLDAANCLLKILEEPPASTIIILQSDKKEGILATVISRCQIIREMNLENAKPETDGFLSIDKISQMSLCERFDYINSILQKDEQMKEKIAALINFWEREYRQKLLSGKDYRSILKRISEARSLLLTNTSVKLLLENIVLEF